jgi:hypothetical protein
MGAVGCERYTGMRKGVVPAFDSESRGAGVNCDASRYLTPKVSERSPKTFCLFQIESVGFARFVGISATLVGFLEKVCRWALLLRSRLGGG